MEHERRKASMFEEPWPLGVVALGLMPLIGLRLALLVVDPTKLPTTLTLPITALLQIWMLAFPLCVLHRRGLKRLEMPRIREVFQELLRAMLNFMLIVLLVGGGFAAWEYLRSKPQPSVSVQHLLESVPTSALWPFIFVVVLFGPIAEETFFRGMVFNAFRQRISLPLAACLQAILFGFNHYFGIQHSLIAIAIGLCLAFVYTNRKTLFAPILVHCFFNSAAIAIGLIGIVEEANAPRLGVFGTECPEGCFIEKVSPDSSADESGLRLGDLVTMVDDQPVTNTAQIRDIVRAKRVGDTVEISFVRQGQTHRVEARLKAKHRVEDESKKN